MIVYVLLRSIDYEGSTIVGIYSTPEKAAEAEEVDRDQHYSADHWDIEEFEVQ